MIITDDDDVEPSLQEIAIQKLLQRECPLDKEEESRRIEPNDKDDYSLWHKWMQWDQTFCGKDLEVT